MHGPNYGTETMTTLNEPRPKARYNCSQSDLYMLGWILAGNYDRHKERFKAKSTKYTDDTGAQLRELVRQAEQMPTEEIRTARHAVARIKLGATAVECLVIWKQLATYIRDASDDMVLKARLKQAGKSHYARAQNDEWPQVVAMMSDGGEYIRQHREQLTEGGMVENFEEEFAGLAAELEIRLTEFRQAEKDARTGGDAKLKLSNELFRQVMRMCTDGRNFFRDWPAVRLEFTFVALMRLIRHHVRRHRVHGAVIRATDGKPVVYALLLLQRQLPTGLYGIAIEGRTDLDGLFAYTGVRKGRYRLTVRTEGGEDVVRDVEVDDGPVSVGPLIVDC